MAKGFLRPLLQLLLLHETAGLQGGEAYGRQSANIIDKADNNFDRASIQQEKLALTGAVQKELGRHVPTFKNANRELLRRIKQAPLPPNGTINKTEYVAKLMGNIWADVLHDTGSDVAFEALHNVAKNTSLARRMQHFLDQENKKCGCVKHLAFVFGWSWGFDMGRSYALWQFPKPLSKWFKRMVKQEAMEEPENDLAVGFGASFDFRLAFAGDLQRALFGISIVAPIMDVGESTNPFSVTIGIYENQPGWAYTFGGNYDIDGARNEHNRLFSKDFESWIRAITGTTDHQGLERSLGGGYAISGSWTFGVPSDFVGLNFDICWNIGDATPLQTREADSRSSRENSRNSQMIDLESGMDLDMEDDLSHDLEMGGFPLDGELTEYAQRWGKFYGPPLIPFEIPAAIQLFRLFRKIKDAWNKYDRPPPTGQQYFLGWNECRGGLKHFSFFQSVAYAWFVEMKTASPTQAPAATRKVALPPTAAITSSVALPTVSPIKALTPSLLEVAALQTKRTRAMPLFRQKLNHEAKGSTAHWPITSSGPRALPRQTMREGLSHQGLELLQARPQSFNNATNIVAIGQNQSRLVALIEKLGPKVYHEMREQDTKSAFTSTQNKSHVLLRGSVNLAKGLRLTWGGGVGAAAVIGMRPAKDKTGLAFELRIPKMACLANNYFKNHVGHYGWEPSDYGQFSFWGAIGPYLKNLAKGCLGISGLQLLFGLQLESGWWIYFPYTFTAKVLEYGFGVQILDESTGKILDYKSNSDGGFYAGHFEDAMGLVSVCRKPNEDNDDKNQWRGLSISPGYQHTHTWTTGLNEKEVEGAGEHVDGHRHQWDLTIKGDHDSEKVLGSSDLILNLGFDTNFKGRNKFSKVEVKQDVWLGKPMECENQREPPTDPDQDPNPNFVPRRPQPQTEPRDHMHGNDGNDGRPPMVPPNDERLLEEPIDVELPENPRDPEAMNLAPIPNKPEIDVHVDPKLPNKNDGAEPLAINPDSRTSPNKDTPIVIPNPKPNEIVEVDGNAPMMNEPEFVKPITPKSGAVKINLPPVHNLDISTGNKPGHISHEPITISRTHSSAELVNHVSVPVIDPKAPKEDLTVNKHIAQGTVTNEVDNAPILEPTIPKEDLTFKTKTKESLVSNKVDKVPILEPTISREDLTVKTKTKESLVSNEVDSTPVIVPSIPKENQLNVNPKVEEIVSPNQDSLDILRDLPEAPKGGLKQNTRVQESEPESNGNGNKVPVLED